MGGGRGDSYIYNRWSWQRHEGGHWRESSVEMGERKREECAQGDSGMPTVSSNVAVAFSVHCRALHHRWVFLLVPGFIAPLPSPVPLCLPGPPAAGLIYWFSTASPAINHRNGGRRWLGCGARRDGRKRKGRMDRLEEEEKEGEGGPGSLSVQQTGYWWVFVSLPRTCARATFSWVLHKGIMGLLEQWRSLEDIWSALE